jgi:hypothetical protein
MTGPDDTDPLEHRLRTAPWDLPVTESLIDTVRDTLPARAQSRHRRRVAAVSASVAAVLLLVAFIIIVPILVRDSPRSSVPAVGRSTTPTPSPSGGTTQTVKVGPYTFDVPHGWLLDPQVSTSTARFGREGLQNDGERLQANDMAVGIEMRMVTLDNGHKLAIAVLTPRPTKDHPGPRPAAVPTDAAAAARTIVDIETSLGEQPAPVRHINGITLGQAILQTFDDHNGILFILPTGAADVVMLQAGGAPMDALEEMAASGRR